MRPPSEAALFETNVDPITRLSTDTDIIISGYHPTFFDEQLDSTVGAIDYVRGSGN